MRLIKGGELVDANNKEAIGMVQVLNEAEAFSRPTPPLL